MSPNLSEIETQLVHPLPLVFDLVTSMLVPHIQKRSARALWPIESLPRGSGPRVFRNDADKVVTTLSDLDRTLKVREVRQRAKPRSKPWILGTSLDFVGQYFVEVMFQRFFAWAVHHVAKPDPRWILASKYYYGNGAGNARAVLSMPLICDLYHSELQVYIQQGNFGYRAARKEGEAQWIYPQLDDYLSAVYHPWIPDRTKYRRAVESRGLAEAQSVYQRGLSRSRTIAGELLKLLSVGQSLWETKTGQPTVQEIRDDWFVPDGDSPISPFVRTAVCSERLGLGAFWRSAKPAYDISAAVAKIQAEKLWLDDDKSEVPQLIRDFLDELKASREPVAQSAREFAHFLGIDPNSLTSLIVEHGAPSGSFVEFVRSRLAEEGLRLLTDRVFLYRRQEDPAITRPAEFARFANRGMAVVLVPEIHLNLCLADQLEQPCLPLLCAPHAARPETGSRLPDCRENHESRREAPEATDSRKFREELCAAWIEKAKELYANEAKRAGIWAKGHFPYHALFETLLPVDSQDPAASSRDHLMARALSFLVPAPGAKVLSRMSEDEAMQALRGPVELLLPAERFLKWVRELGKGDAKTPKSPEFVAFLKNPLAGLPARLAAWKSIPSFQDRGQASWEWIVKQLASIFSVQTATVEEAAETLKRDVTFEKLWWMEWPLSDESESDSDRRARDFFALSSFRSVNAAIMRGLTGFGPTQTQESLLNVRLLAPERSTKDGAELQDFADFIGTFIPQLSEELLQKENTNKARELLKVEVRTMDDEPSWVPDLVRLKVLVRILGTSLLNLVRTKQWRELAKDEEKERLRDLVRTLLHGYQKTAANFPTLIQQITKEIDDPVERVGWGDFTAYVVEAHTARMASVDAGVRRLMEPDNTTGFLQTCRQEFEAREKASREPGAIKPNPPMWHLFLNAMAHGCLLGYVSKLIEGGQTEIQKRIDSAGRDELLKHLRLTRYHPSRKDGHKVQYYPEVFALMAKGIGNLPQVTVEHPPAASYQLVLPSEHALADRLITCWTLVFSELMANMLDDQKEPVRKISFRFAPDPVAIICTFETFGLAEPNSGQLQAILASGKTEDHPIRPKHESGGGWGHYGNFQFVNKVMGVLNPQQDYVLRIERRDDGLYDVATRMTLASPCVCYTGKAK